LLQTGFVCLVDPKPVRVKKRSSERDDFASEHVSVSYDADRRRSSAAQAPRALCGREP
jgi:hypothetical protein